MKFPCEIMDGKLFLSLF